MGPYGIVLADDHVLIRQGIRKIIEGVADLEVVGEADDGLALLLLLDTVPPDMVILDISMPKLRGLEAISQIKIKYPETKVLVLSMHKEYFNKALSAGADGYLLKEDADRELFSAIENIRQGRKYLSPGVMEMLVERVASGEALSVLEKEILKLIARGKRKKEIAELLLISVSTVSSRRANIMKKLHLQNSADLVKYALQKGYV